MIGLTALPHLITSPLASAAAPILAASEQVPDTGGLLQYGVLGIFAGALAIGKLVPGSLVDKRDAEIARLQEELERARKRESDLLLPALAESNKALARVAEHELQTRQDTGR